MTDLSKAGADQISAALAEAKTAYGQIRGRNLAFDMTRGKPSAAQLDQADALLTNVDHDDVVSVGQESVDERRADESGSPGDDGLHPGPLSPVPAGNRR